MRCGEPDLDVWVSSVERVELRDQPTHHEGRKAGDNEWPLRGRCGYARCRCLEHLHGLPDRGKERHARRCELDAPVKSAKQRNAEIVLDRLDLPAHRTVREVQLFGGSADAAPARNELERRQGLQWWQPAHRGPSYEFCAHDSPKPSLVNPRAVPLPTSACLRTGAGSLPRAPPRRLGARPPAARLEAAEPRRRPTGRRRPTRPRASRDAAPGRRPQRRARPSTAHGRPPRRPAERRGTPTAPARHAPARDRTPAGEQTAGRHHPAPRGGAPERRGTTGERGGGGEALGPFSEKSCGSSQPLAHSPWLGCRRRSTD